MYTGPPTHGAGVRPDAGREALVWMAYGIVRFAMGLLGYGGKHFVAPRHGEGHPLLHRGPVAAAQKLQTGHVDLGRPCHAVVRQTHSRPPGQSGQDDRRQVGIAQHMRHEIEELRRLRRRDLDDLNDQWPRAVNEIDVVKFPFADQSAVGADIVFPR